jgi:hypothetical protein
MIFGSTSGSLSVASFTENSLEFGVIVIKSDGGATFAFVGAVGVVLEHVSVRTVNRTNAKMLTHWICMKIYYISTDVKLLCNRKLCYNHLNLDSSRAGTNVSF